MAISSVQAETVRLAREESDHTYNSLLARVRMSREQLSRWTQSREARAGAADKLPPSSVKPAAVPQDAAEHVLAPPPSPESSSAATMMMAGAAVERRGASQRSRRHSVEMTSPRKPPNDPSLSRRPVSARAVLRHGQSHDLGAAWPPPGHAPGTHPVAMDRWVAALAASPYQAPMGGGSGRPGEPLRSAMDETMPLPPLPSYNEPQPPAAFWPVMGKPPTLQQMESDMRTWAKQRHEVKALSEHNGRMLEWQRAKAAFNDLLLRDERLTAANAALRARVEELEGREGSDAVRLAVLEDERHDREGEMAATDRKLEEMAAHVKRVEALAAVKNEEARSLHLRVAELSEERSRLAEKSRIDGSKARGELERMAFDLETSESRIRATEEELASAHRANDELTRKFAALERHMGEQDDVATRQAQMLREEMHAKAKEHAVEVGRLQAAVEVHASKATEQERAMMAEAARAREVEMKAQRERKLAAAAAKLAAEERDTRVTEFMRMTARRMLSRDLAGGFAAWTSFWEAKAYALGRMRQIATRLHPKTRELARMFETWAEQCREGAREAELSALEKTVRQMRLDLEIKDREIGRLKSVIVKLAPAETTGAFAQKQREKQRKAFEKKQQAREKNSSMLAGRS